MKRIAFVLLFCVAATALAATPDWRSSDGDDGRQFTGLAHPPVALQIRVGRRDCYTPYRFETFGWFEGVIDRPASGPDPARSADASRSVSSFPSSYLSTHLTV